MPPSMRFRCPVCQVRIKATFQLLGQTRPCPKCGHAFVVQPEPPEDSGPLLVQEELQFAGAPGRGGVF